MSDQDLISLDELAETLAAYADESSPIRRSQQNTRRSTKVLLAIAAAALAFAGGAYGAGFNPFAGIIGADHPATANDTLDPPISDYITTLNQQWNGTLNGALEPDTARLLSTLPSGSKIYVVATTGEELCVLIQETPGSGKDTAMGCGAPLSQSQPTTDETFQPDPSTPPLSFGVAQDGVTSVSFATPDGDVTVPVINNVWIYQGRSDAGSSLTVHYANGDTKVVG